MASYHRSLSPELARLQTFTELEEFVRGDRAAMNFEQFEEELGRRINRLQAELTAAELARHDVGAPSVVIGEQVFRRCLEKEPKRYLTASGPVVVERNLYRPAGGGKAVCPLELRVGIIGDCTSNPA
jgi:hypothetical protein